MTDSTVETREVDPEDDKEVVTFKKTIASFNRESVSTSPESNDEATKEEREKINEEPGKQRK